jgi:TfoX/Sxy family transcriptional regulator of competence genes
LAYSEALADRVREHLAEEKRISEREMFGGLGFMWAGNMVCGVRGEELMVRVGPDLHHDALTRPHTREMDFTGRPMKGFVYVGREGVADDSELGLWVRLGLAHAKTFPAKAPPKKKRKAASATKKAVPAKKAVKKSAKKRR